MHENKQIIKYVQVSFAPAFCGNYFELIQGWKNFQRRRRKKPSKKYDETISQQRAVEDGCSINYFPTFREKCVAIFLLLCRTTPTFVDAAVNGSFRVISLIAHKVKVNNGRWWSAFLWALPFFPDFALAGETAKCKEIKFKKEKGSLSSTSGALKAKKCGDGTETGAHYQCATEAEAKQGFLHSPLK